MEKWLANPFYKDIFCEVDFMDKGNWFEMDHILWRESQWMVIDSFSSHFITLHVDDGWPDGPVNGGGEYLRYVGYTIEPADGIGSEFYKNHFSIERHGIFIVSFYRIHNNFLRNNTAKKTKYLNLMALKDANIFSIYAITLLKNIRKTPGLKDFKPSSLEKFILS